MQGTVLGVERRRRWSSLDKARIVEETLIPGAVVCEVARRNGVSQSLIFAWRREARTGDPGAEGRSVLLPVDVGEFATASALREAADPRSGLGRRKSKPGVIEIQLGSGTCLRVDNEVDADALRRVVKVLSER